MKRFLMLVAVAAVAGAMYVAAAPGSQRALPPTAAQFASLKKQVARLSKTLTALKKDEGKVKTLAVDEGALLLTCMQVAVPVNQFGDSTNQTEGFRYAKGPLTAPTSELYTTALDVTADTDTNAVFFVGGDSSCATALSGGTTSLRHQAAAAGVQLPHLAAHQAFVAHRP